ncbi:hypothetical protein [Flavobacterium sp.]|uniref:hypothetical protein n=1 Tax=Flavobacterium sp. TaxID=239 RepID=UPI003752CDE3
MKKIIILIVITICTNVFGQEREATILFNDSTSVKGFGEIKKEKIYFRVSLDAKIKEWDFKMASGLIFSGYGFSEKYLYIKPDKYSKKPIIMEVMEEGNVNLYKKSFITQKAYVDPTKSLTYFNYRKIYVYDFESTYYVKRKNEENATDLSFSFKINSVKYFSDCKILVEKINKKEFKKDNIVEIVYYYNDYCDEEEN